MRWLVKTPKPGEIRTRTFFAWEPTEAGDYMVWLGWVEVHEFYFTPSSGAPGWWSEAWRGPASGILKKVLMKR